MGQSQWYLLHYFSVMCVFTMIVFSVLCLYDIYRKATSEEI